MYYPLLVILLFSIIIGQILLILLSVRGFSNIQLSYNNIISISKDFPNTYIKAKDEIALLHKEIIELITLTTKKEQGILHMTFRLEEMHICIEMLLNEFRELTNTTSQTKEKK
ncbi:hypothetical protein [Candidatus Tisiphia endosymbiont of Melanophora roralis]|jgi:hypothetical protein|uniref:hypothetical protein n=1 Tax=Candidatus Tisiphia endosymbiont of Melanophora roralis TaxID=3066261 RepID=UPI001E6F77F2|nr:MAG: hypothetical protein LF884_05600 [Rickettsia endosymbiont of Cimex lectularius]